MTTYSYYGGMREPDPEPVECWNCGRIIMTATGYISCTCGCGQSPRPERPLYADDLFDPEFAATTSCP